MARCQARWLDADGMWHQTVRIPGVRERTRTNVREQPGVREQTQTSKEFANERERTRTNTCSRTVHEQVYEHLTLNYTVPTDRYYM